MKLLWIDFLSWVSDILDSLSDKLNDYIMRKEMEGRRKTDN